MTFLQVLDNLLPSLASSVALLDAMDSRVFIARIEYPAMSTCETLRISIPVTICHTSVGIFVLFFMLLPIEVILVRTLADGAGERAERLMWSLCASSISSILLAQSNLLQGSR